MAHELAPVGIPFPRLRLPAVTHFSVAIALALAASAGGYVGTHRVISWGFPKAETPSSPPVEAPSPAEAAAPAAEPSERVGIAEPAPIAPATETLPAAPAVADPAPMTPAAATPVGPAAPAETGAAGSPALRMVPLPVPRPAEFDRPQAAVARPPRRVRQAAPAPAAPAAEDDRNFIEKLFGIERTKSPALAYAALESGPVERQARPRVVPAPITAPAPSLGGPPLAIRDPVPGVAVYDITAKVVLLPNGERLEAHSGLGDGFDNPARVHVPMRGATPPGTYDLTERERPFHGVRAIRLTPVGGSDAIHGRVGLLAHTYMLGPTGASNGCVSFRDYDRFLQAYLRGEVQRLVVVASR